MYDSERKIQKELYSITDAAKILGRHKNTIRKWIDLNYIKHYAFPGRGGKEFFIKKTDLDDFIENHKVSTP